MAIRQFAAKRPTTVARVRIQPTGSDPRSAALPNDGAITVEMTAALLGVTIAVATDALVDLRTYLHNRFIVPRLTAGPTAEVNQFATEAALTAEAASALANALDAIDEVAVRLDLRVLERQPVRVALGNPGMLTRSQAASVHQATLFALRPYMRLPERHPYMSSPQAVQLCLPLPQPALAGFVTSGVDAEGSDTSVAEQALRIGRQNSVSSIPLNRQEPRSPARAGLHGGVLMHPSASRPFGKGREGSASRQ